MPAPFTVIDQEIERRHAEMKAHFRHSPWQPSPPTREEVCESLLSQAFMRLLPTWAQVNAQTLSQWLSLGESNAVLTEAIQQAFDAVGLGPDGSASLGVELDNTESWITYSKDPNGGATGMTAAGRSRGACWTLKIHPDAFDLVERAFPPRCITKA